MARKGSFKVRTGCITCKIRRVKCDEDKPFCRRCTSTGRKCDGYAPQPNKAPLPQWETPRPLAPAPSSSEASISPRTPSPIHAFSSPQDRRSLQMFCELVVPSFSMPYSPHLWRKLVLQVAQAEPAARHSILAISSLYEDFYCHSKPVYQLKENKAALAHYNAAIREITTAQNVPLVLLVCLLFICIDSFQGNLVGVLQHSKHGLDILQKVRPHGSSSWVKDYLAPIFRRLSIVPLYYGMESFLPPPSLDEQIPDRFTSTDEAGYFMEGLLVRTIQLGRVGWHYPYGPATADTIAPDLKERQADLLAALGKWRTAALAFESWHKSSWSDEIEAMSCSLWMQLYTCEIWASIATTPGEGVFDAYFDHFQNILRRAEIIGRIVCGISSRGSSPASTMSNGSSPITQAPITRRAFQFEMNYNQYMVYLISKSRKLAQRVEALRLMKTYGADRESLWDRDTLHAAGTRLVEFEHGVVLDERGTPIGDVDWEFIPPVELRTEDLMSFLPQQQ